MEYSPPPWWRRTYDRLFEFIARPRLQAGDLEPGVIHSHLVVVLATSTVMWAYSLVSTFTMSSPWPAIVGVASSLVHMLSPLLFRWTNNSLLVCSVMLVGGMAHQTVFVCFNGGYLSGILTWYAFLPSLGGVIAGRRGAILWLIITVLGGLAFLSLHLVGVQFPQGLSPLGGILSQALLVFGWIMLAVMTVLVHITAWEWRRQESDRQRVRFEDLFRALFHDLAAPIGTIEMTIPTLRAVDGQQRDDGVQMIEQAVDSMRSITGGARLLYSLDKGLVVAGPAMARLDVAVQAVVSLMHQQAQAKSVRCALAIDALKGQHVAGDEGVLVHHIFANVLSNAIKFSSIGGTVQITGEVIDSVVVIIIRDQGIGMPVDVLSSLAGAANPIIRTGTTGERGSGFGLQLARSFLRRFSGDMTIQSPSTSSSAHRQGTIITIHLPLLLTPPVTPSITPPVLATAPLH